MALNIAVPLSGVGGLSPISPIGLDCWEQIKMLVSPIGSESSGISSLDSEEAKQQSLQSTPPDTPEEFEIKYHGRDILDLGANINPDKWTLRYTYLPENNNMPMYLANRSQYHRLGPNGHIQDYSLVKCEHCDFQYPINSGNSYFCRTSVTVSPTTTSTMTYSRPPMFNRHSQSNLFHHQQQQSQQSLLPLQNSLYHSNNSNYNNSNNNNNLYGNNQMNSNSFLKKTSATTISTAATCTFSSASSSASSFASSSPTSSISSGYGSSSSINNGNYNNFGVGGLRYPQQQSPPHNSNSLFMNKNNSHASNIKSGIPSSTFNNFGSFLNAFSNNSANNNNNNNNGYINQTQLNSVGQQQPSYVGVYNYFS